MNLGALPDCSAIAEIEMMSTTFLLPVLTTVAIALVAGVGLVISALLRRNRALQKEIDRNARIARTDELTGLNNRRCFHDTFEREHRLARRMEQPLGVVLFDIDNFKSINDSYGHGVGDETLRALAQVVQAELRISDHVFRWGGEEFLVLAGNGDFDGTCALAERLRLAIEDHYFDRIGPVTCSFGVAALEEGDDETTLVRRADDALYFAKRSGRNRIEGFRFAERVSDVAPAPLALAERTDAFVAVSGQPFLRLVD